MEITELKILARFVSPFKSKFGIPKQSGIVDSLVGDIVLEAEFRNPDYLRGIEGYDYLWLLWGFSGNRHAAHSPVVRPPVLGGNTRVGVLATRSPFRPNPIGLSSVRLEGVDWDDARGPVLHVSGADLMDGTPIYDIKPYLPYTDSHPDARSGFTTTPQATLEVVIDDALAATLSPQQLATLRDVLAHDPRPSYQNDPEKVYGMPFDNLDVRFKVDGSTLTVVEIAR